MPLVGLELCTRYVVRGMRYEVRGTRCEVRGTWYEVRGTRYEVWGTWYKVHLLGIFNYVETKGVEMWHKMLDTRLKAQRETNEVRSAQHKTVSPKGVLK